MYLFGGKGSPPASGRGKMYEECDFDSNLFPVDWYVAYDKLGDGCCIDFPVRMLPSIKWSRTVYSKAADGSLVPKAKTFSEMISVTVVKERC